MAMDDVPRLNDPIRRHMTWRNEAERTNPADLNQNHIGLLPSVLRRRGFANMASWMYCFDRVSK